MAYIKLTRNKAAIVDDEDFNYLNQWKWAYARTGYAYRTKYLGGGRKNEKNACILMHRLILQTPKGMETDHINGNRLDNRKSNLRICTRLQNLGNSVGYSRLGNPKGTEKRGERWVARIGRNRKTIYLGMFDTPEEASETYDKAAQKHYGTSFVKVRA